MFYREIGQYKTSYAADQQVFAIRQDRLIIAVLLLAAIFLIPYIANDYWLIAVLIPTLSLALAALGLNILTGYCGQLSLGTAAFMSIGGFATYNLVMRIPEIPFPISMILSGVVAGLAGVLVGLPSLRIKGFYLVVSTLAAHFFVQWLFDTVKWFKRNNPQGEVKPPPFKIFDYVFTSPESLYLLALVFVIILTVLAKNMMRSTTGRRMMAVRDMEVAASVMGISIGRTKLLAFAISSFYCGIAGSLYVNCYMHLLDTKTYSIELAFATVFMVVVGGMGTIMGAFIGAAFIFLLPIWMNATFGKYGIDPSQIQNISKMIFGTLVILLLIVEPNGLARLWMRAKDKLRKWPFPY
ncbi:MAG: branched-chain amino acid ABC transporter permease [Thermodesulfovibrionales bacterium]